MNVLVPDLRALTDVAGEWACEMTRRGSAWYSQRGAADASAAIWPDPKAQQAYKQRGQILSRMGRCDEAIADFRKALALNPADEGVKKSLRELRVYRSAGPSFREEGTMREGFVRTVLLLFAACSPASALAQSCNTADRSVLLVLDASGSMNARLPNGETRIDVARRAMKGVTTLIPGKAQISLRLYGAQSPARDKNCQDTNLAIPFGVAEIAGATIAAKVDGAKAQGYTPIALSLQQAANDFPADAKERVIVLVSDGKETCEGDPVVAAKALAARGITVHAVGFVVDTAARGQLQSIAQITGGTYFDAPVGPELPDTLKSALNACKQQVAKLPSRPQPGKLRTTSTTWLASHTVFNAETGAKVGSLDSATREITLPAGIYEVKFGAGSWKGIEVRPGETTTIQPGEIKLDPTAGAIVVDSETEQKHGSFDRMSSAVTLMPGVYDVRMGKTSWTFLKVDGGKTVLLRPAQVKLASDLKWKKARVMTVDGGEVFRFDAVTWRATLAPGNYVVEVDGNKIPFNAAEGDVLDVKPQ